MTPQLASASVKPIAQGATASLVCGILSFSPAWLLAGIPAIIFGHRARKEINHRSGLIRGSRRALTGLVLGYASALGPLLYIAVIFLGLLLGAIPAIRQGPKRTEALQMTASLIVAINAYSTEYSRTPAVPLVNPTQDGELDNAEILDILRNIPSANNPGYTRNPRKVIFFDANPKAFSKSALVDPWGRPYHIGVDMDGDGQTTIGPMKAPKSIAIWFDGPNGINEFGGGDDVTSW